MKIQRGIVQYQDRNDIECLYGVLDDNIQYYFMDNTGKTLSNGNIIASTSLTEAIDPMHEPKEIGLIDPQGNIVIPFENKSIKPINDELLLVERAVPISQSVIDACKVKNDPLSATSLVSTAATIKANLNSLTMSQGEYIFNDMFSEATMCDNNGNNLMNNEYYSFITMTSDKIFFSKNTADSQIVEYTFLAPQASNQVENNNLIDVNNINVDSQQVDNALQQGDVTISGSDLQTNSVDLNTSENNVDVQNGANDLSSQQPIQDTTQLIGDSLASEVSQSIENGVIQVSDQIQQNVVQGEESTNITDTNDSNNEVVVDRESNSDVSNTIDNGLLSQNGDVSGVTFSTGVVDENTQTDDNQNDDGLNDEIQQVDEQIEVADENNNVNENSSVGDTESVESNNNIVDDNSVDNDNSDQTTGEDESNVENTNEVSEESNLVETGESVSEDSAENNDSKEEVQDNSVDLGNDALEVSKNIEEKVIDENELLNSVVNNGEEINGTEEEHDDTVSLNLNQDNNNVTDDTISLDLNQTNNDEADDVTDSVEMDDINTSLENSDLAEDGGLESIFNEDMGTDIFEDSIARADSIRDEDDDFSDSYDDGEVDNSMPVSDTVSNINRLIRGYKKLHGEVFNLKSEVKQLRSKNRAQTEQMKKAVIVINKETAKNKKLLTDNRELQRENAKKDKKIIMLTNQVKSYNEVEKILGNINVELDDYDDSSSYRMAA